MGSKITVKYEHRRSQMYVFLHSNASEPSSLSASVSLSSSLPCLSVCQHSHPEILLLHSCAPVFTCQLTKPLALAQDCHSKSEFHFSWWRSADQAAHCSLTRVGRHGHFCRHADACRPECPNRCIGSSWPSSDRSDECHQQQERERGQAPHT